MMGRIFLLVLLLAGVPVAAEPVPRVSLAYLPELVGLQRSIWPDAPMSSFLAAQIEQETCITLTHRSCWNPKAELKTSREHGVGLGQFTRAWHPDGSLRFDKISELAATHENLRGWSWEKRFDARYQLTAIIEMDKAIYGRQRGVASNIGRLSFMLAAYNGGEGGVLQDRRLCSNTVGCDPSRWLGHVEKTSLKSRLPAPGYRKSFFQINREYVYSVLHVRRAKYESFFAGGDDGR